MAFKKVTEESSLYRHLEKMSVSEIVSSINKEDKKVADQVADALPQITALIEAVSKKMKKGGRLFYIGAGTSGRLGILDASECPPTYGVPHGL
ncbi:MAG TPA: N-acetylmuramic acid 6-phosphate etherase, partial [Ginsengibacter sp.]|nr:N-acetylmuramic acid 6-phosphate etherase [Ginsengibacter sp.]